MNFFSLFIYWFWFVMIIFFLLKHPLAMGLMLIVNTFFLSVFVLLFSFTSWNSYILFLMFLSGILILFLYNISLITSEMFDSISIMNFFKTMLLFFVALWFFNFKSSFMVDLNLLTLKEAYPMYFFFLKLNLNTVTFLMTYLFFSLIAIVNLVYLMKDKGSMRI